METVCDRSRLNKATVDPEGIHTEREGEEEEEEGGRRRRRGGGGGGEEEEGEEEGRRRRRPHCHLYFSGIYSRDNNVASECDQWVWSMGMVD